MAAEEGLRRLRLVGRAILGIGLVLVAGVAIGFVTSSFAHSPPWTLNFAPLAVALSMIGAGILLIAWIVEGFVHPPRPPHS
jgi:F0F1-type ATP synthase assembly protein I